MQKITTKVVFDRKKVTAKDKCKKGLVQLQLVLNRKQVFMSTGVKLLANQWSTRDERVINTNCNKELNDIISAMVLQVEKYNAEVMSCGFQPSLEDLKLRMQNGSGDSFINYMRMRIRERTDIRESTRKMHYSVLNILEKYGKIKYFHDVTVENITKFGEWLHGQGVKQSTIYTKHKCLKHYVSEAVLWDKLPRNPYKLMKLNKGKSEEGRYISPTEMRQIMCCIIPKRYEKVRDLMIFQFYTGLSYSDLKAFDSRRIKMLEGQKIYTNSRVKTGQQFYVAILPMAEQVLEKYGYNLPKISNQKYNDYMKTVATLAQVKDGSRLASHWLRRSYGMWLLNEGVQMEVVSKSLGHASIKETEQSYARILEKTVAKAVRNVKTI